MQFPERKEGMTPEEWWDHFQTLLEDQVDWPADYVFKFIVPRENVEEVQTHLEDAHVTIRESSRGSYQSLTATMRLDSGEAVVQIYRRVGAIDGVISL